MCVYFCSRGVKTNELGLYWLDACVWLCSADVFIHTQQWILSTPGRKINKRALARYKYTISLRARARSSSGFFFVCVQPDICRFREICYLSRVCILDSKTVHSIVIFQKNIFAWQFNNNSIYQEESERNSEQYQWRAGESRECAL